MKGDKGVDVLTSWYPTFTTSLHLTHRCQGVGQKIREPPVQVNCCQTTLKSLTGVDQLGQLSVHLFGNTPDVQITCKATENSLLTNVIKK